MTSVLVLLMVSSFVLALVVGIIYIALYGKEEGETSKVVEKDAFYYVLLFIFSFMFSVFLLLSVSLMIIASI